MNKNHKPILGKYRNNWYNSDFLELMAVRLGLSNYSNMLDVGCGKFHWSALLSPFLDANHRITGIDLNKPSDEEMAEIEQYNSLNGSRLEFVCGDSNRMPFADSSFDIVTCQTLLIHLDNPATTLSEMYRVLKKDGIILLSEPNNLSQVIFRNSLNVNESVDERLKIIEAKMLSERHKIEDKNGDNSVGELVPVLLEDIGFRDIECYLNDKVTSLKPPYGTDAEKQKIEMLSRLIDDYPYTFSESEKNEIRAVLEAIKNQMFSAYSPTMLFLTVAKK